MKLYLILNDEIIESASLERVFKDQIEVEVSDDFDEMSVFDYKCVNGELVKLTTDEKEEIYPVDHKAEQEAILEAMMFESMKASFISDMPDEQAVEIPLMFDSWTSYIGQEMKAGTRFEYKGELWKCRQNIPAVLEHQPPSIETASLYERIDESHAGTIDDPIPYATTMTVHNGKYYLENGIVYKCIRDSGQPLYATCASLVGNFFVVA